MKRLLILFALFVICLEADAQGVRFWAAGGIGGSSFGFTSMTNLTVSNGSIAGGVFTFSNAGSGGSFRVAFEDSEDREVKGLRVGLLKSAEEFTNGLYLGVGKMTGRSQKEEYCSDTGFGFGFGDGCSRDIESMAVVAEAEFMRHRKQFGVGFKPFLIYGNSDVWLGLTVQLVVGKFS